MIIQEIRQATLETRKQFPQHTAKAIRRTLIDSMHGVLTEQRVPRSENGNRLGLRKRLELSDEN